MKEFMLLIRNEVDHQVNWPPEQHQQFLKKCEVYIGNLTKAGKLISAQPLVREGKMVLRNNGTWAEANFHESKEVIVGYYHILARDQEEAIALAKQNPEFEYKMVIWDQFTDINGDRGRLPAEEKLTSCQG